MELCSGDHASQVPEALISEGVGQAVGIACDSHTNALSAVAALIRQDCACRSNDEVFARK